MKGSCLGFEQSSRVPRVQPVPLSTGENLGQSIAGTADLHAEPQRR